MSKYTSRREYIPVDPKELANRIFVTCYMGSENSSEDTQSRAKNLAEDVGSYHMGKKLRFIMFCTRVNSRYWVDNVR